VGGGGKTKTRGDGSVPGTLRGLRRRRERLGILFEGYRSLSDKKMARKV
jgi:hypothetical protein